MYLQNDDEVSEIAARCGRVADLIKQSGESEKMSGAELRLKRYVIFCPIIVIND